MKRMMIFPITLLFALLSLGQQQTSRVYTTASFNPGVDSVAEQLVLLAMNNPQIKSLENHAQAQQYVYLRSKSIWLNSIVISGNLNEYNIKKFDPTNPYYNSILYPRYNFGVQLPVGIITNNKRQTKAELSRYQAAVNDVEAHKLEIRKLVMISWNDYQINQQLTIFQDQVVIDARLFYAKTEEKYKKGEINLEDYVLAGRNKNAEEVRLLTAQRDLLTAQAQLEELIGMNLDDALAMFKAKSGSHP